jgi:hypothetical protein
MWGVTREREWRVKEKLTREVRGCTPRLSTGGRVL